MKSLKVLKTGCVILLCYVLCSQIDFAFGGGGGGKGQSSPPKYYSVNDLIDELSKKTFITDGWYKPGDALVTLDYSPVYAANVGQKRATARALVANPRYKNRARIFSTNVDWTKTATMAFDWDRYWNKSGGRKGDLIFNRGTGTGAEVIKRVSHFTHVAFSYGWKEVFESTQNTGVRRNNTDNSWGSSLTHYTCKRLKWVSYYDAEKVVDWGISNYSGKPYIPSLAVASYSQSYFLLKWGSKYDIDSMYCSKLVFLCYKNNPYIKKNLDTGVTGCFSDSSMVEDENTWTGSIFNWVGVSPDDIYYSDELGPDFCYRI